MHRMLGRPVAVPGYPVRVGPAGSRPHQSPGSPRISEQIMSAQAELCNHIH